LLIRQISTLEVLPSRPHGGDGGDSVEQLAREPIGQGGAARQADCKHPRLVNSEIGGQPVELAADES